MYGCPRLRLRLLTFLLWHRATQRQKAQALRVLLECRLARDRKSVLASASPSKRRLRWPYHGGYRCRKGRRRQQQRRYDEQESDSPPLLRQEGSCSCCRIEPTSTTTPDKMCNAEQHGTCRTNNDAPDAGTAERAAAVAAAEGDAAYAAISDYESEDSAFSSFSRG